MCLSSFKPIFFLMATLVAILFLHQLRTHPVVQFRMLTPPTPHIESLSFGFSDVIADSFWLTLIQDLGECELVVKLEPWRQKKCGKGWSFQMLNAITLLAPRFRMPFAAGAITLSVLSDDVAGANIIFERAIANFPNDWPILYRAAYHYMFDLKDKRKAAELMQRAAENGAPRWVHQLAARLFSESGELLLAITNLESLRKQISEPGSLLELDRRIRDLRRRLDRAK